MSRKCLLDVLLTFKFMIESLDNITDYTHNNTHLATSKKWMIFLHLHVFYKKRHIRK